MAREFARLDLLQEVKTEGGGTAKELVVYRPSCRDLFPTIEANTTTKRVETFIKNNVKALNGAGAEPFDSSDLSAADAMELVSIIGSLAEEAEHVSIPNGDGIFEPLVYTLQHPIKLSAEEDGERVEQIEFEARKLGELSEYLDAAGDTKEFMIFMRVFGKLLGTKLPMSDSIIMALDFVDYFVIRRKIMGKLVAPRERWRKISTT